MGRSRATPDPGAGRGRNPDRVQRGTGSGPANSDATGSTSPETSTDPTGASPSAPSGPPTGVSASDATRPAGIPAVGARPAPSPGPEPARGARQPGEPARAALTVRRRRRDRRGRGMRGQLLPRGVPAWRSRADRFDDLVLDAVEHLEHRWARELEGVEFAVEDVPPSDPSPWEHGEVPLGRFFPAEGELPPRIVVYRRPVETRAGETPEVGQLAQNVVVEQVAHLLGLPPDQIDPRYGRDD